MMLQVRQIHVPPGQRVLLENVGWPEFEDILQELGEHRSARIAYKNGILEIMTPLPEHETSKENIGDLIKVLLEELDIDYLPMGSTTFKNSAMLQGIEPDQCFYIQNEAAVRGKDRLDLSSDPPPDLALEIDVTSRTHPKTYAVLQVPELWRFEHGKLQINVLKEGQYITVSESPTFPGLTLNEIIPRYAAQMKQVGRRAAIKAFRGWIRSKV
nr:Uma2 family endonuclease [Acaryochloris thomasi]